MVFEERLEDFDQPWCKAILDSPDYELITDGDHVSRLLPPSKQEKGKTTNAFWADTLATPTTIRACVSFYHAATSEMLMLMSIANGTDGHSGLLHGGLMFTILDETMGLTCARLWKKSLLTAKVEIRFKKPIKTPCLLLARSSLAKMDGRKIFVRGTLEDGQGTVFTETDGLFITLDYRL